jgi:RimJ/RimL family protein N-acetyltransferase
MRMLLSDMKNEIRFRKPTLQDHYYVQSIWEDPETMEAVGGVWPMSGDEYERWHRDHIVDHSETNCYYLVFLDGECVGEVSFHHYDRKTRTADLNIKTKAGWRGRGIGRRALHYILSVFFNDWHGLEMRDIVRQANDLGRRALLAYGFKEMGRPNGNYLMSLGADDFKKINGASN